MRDKILSFLAVLFILQFSPLLAQEATVPHYLNFQSVLRDDGGNLITESFIDLEFKILDQDGQEIYHELQPGVQVVRSAVNVMIGEGVDPNNPSAPKGGLPPSVLDPTNGQKFLQMKIGDNLPSDPMEFGMVPYAAWAEKALTVPNESISSEQIKDGSIKVQDLAPELTFGDINGTASDGQIPSTIATDVELNAHINSTTAHPASAIAVTGSFNFSSTPTVQALLTGLDGGLASEVANRQLKDKEHKDTDINTAHPGQITTGKIQDGTITTDDIANGTIKAEDLASGAGSGFEGWDTNASDDLTTSTTFGGDVSGTYNSIAVSDDSHNHTSSTISGLTVSDFSSANISQWTNDSGYLTSATGDSRYVNVTGDTMTGSLNVPDDSTVPHLSGGNFNVGRAFRNHENRITALEGGAGLDQNVRDFYITFNVQPADSVSIGGTDSSDWTACGDGTCNTDNQNWVYADRTPIVVPVNCIAMTTGTIAANPASYEASSGTFNSDDTGYLRISYSDTRTVNLRANAIGDDGLFEINVRVIAFPVNPSADCSVANWSF